MGESFWLWAVKAFAGGGLGYLAKVLLERAQKKLARLQEKPVRPKGRVLPAPGYSDGDLEELLTHFCEKYGDAKDLTVVKSIQVITSRANVSVTYLRIVVTRYISEEETGGA